jgi:CheY-like chemotaxis protein
VERATKLTRQLTTFGRGTVSAPVVLDLRTHIGEFRDLIEGALRENIALAFAMATDLWPVYVDPVQLELAMLNAALNARDAMPGGGELRITAVNDTFASEGPVDLPAGDYVCIRISDTGTGIADEDLPRVFEPFYTTKAVGKGSGLGLAQIYGFAKQSGGTATIESAASGTTLAVYLPRSTRVEVQRPAAPPTPAHTDAAPSTILFVEDDDLVSEVVVPGLQASGLDVVTARDAPEALEAVRSRHVDAVLSDIVMPGQRDGFDLAQEIRRMRPDMPIVLATGYSDALKATSPFRILLKPYTLDEARLALQDEMQRAKEHAPKI